MVSFSQLPGVKKDNIYGAAGKFFGPSYFVTALANLRIRTSEVQNSDDFELYHFVEKIGCNIIDPLKIP
jgi:hypothetical protein